MRKISLVPYKVNDGKDNYNIKESIEVILFSPHRNVNVRSLFDYDKIVKKVMATTTDDVLLEEAEYQAIKMSVETFDKYTRNDVEFVRRILEAPEANVKEA